MRVNPPLDEFCLLVLRHLPRLRQVIGAMRHPLDRCFLALADALELQVYAGAATPETAYPIAASILVLARTVGIEPDDNGLSHALHPIRALVELTSPPCNCRACQREVCQR